MKPIKIEINPTKLPNKMHFDIQRKVRAHTFRDRTKYTRKSKYKKYDEE